MTRLADDPAPVKNHLVPTRLGIEPDVFGKFRRPASADPAPAALHLPPAGELLRLWERDELRRGRSPDGIAARRNLLRALARHLGETSLLAATRGDIDAFLDTRRTTPATRSGYLSWLHGFYLWAADNELTDADPTLKIKRARRPTGIPRPLAAEDVQAVIAAAEGTMRAWLCLAAWEGLRCCEIASLSREDVLEHAAPPVLIVAHGKGGKQRVLPLNGDAWQAVRAAGLPRSGWLYPHPLRPHEHVPAYVVSQRVGRFLRDCGVDGSAHQLRHSFGTEVYRRSRDLRAVQDLLGHADPKTTSIYTKLVPGGAADIVMGLSRHDDAAAGGTVGT